jgi:CBS domain-containing membrane protein
VRDTAINRIMTTDPATVQVSDPVSAARQLLVSSDFHHLPVVEDGLLVGIISSSDLLRFHLPDGDAAATSSATVGQVMEANPMVLKSDATLRDAATTLSNGGYHALPVVEDNGALVGIVTTVDLVTHLLRQIPRGDGSIHENANANSDSTSRISDSEMSSAVRQAEQSASQGGNADVLARALLHLRDQNRLLENVRNAAELYLRTGNGEHEHSVLIKRLAELQRQ